MLWSVVSTETHEVGHLSTIGTQKGNLENSIARLRSRSRRNSSRSSKKKVLRRTLATNSGVRECVGSCSEVTNLPLFGIYMRVDERVQYCNLCRTNETYMVNRNLVNTLNTDEKVYFE